MDCWLSEEQWEREVRSTRRDAVSRDDLDKNRELK